METSGTPMKKELSKDELYALVGGGSAGMSAPPRRSLGQLAQSVTTKNGYERLDDADPDATAVPANKGFIDIGGKEWRHAPNMIGWHQAFQRTDAVSGGAMADVETGGRTDDTHKNLGMIYHRKTAEFVGVRYSQMPLEAAAKLAEKDPKVVGFGIHPEVGVQFYSDKALKGGTLMAHKDWDCYLKPSQEYVEPAKPKTEFVSVGGKQYRFEANSIGRHDASRKNLGMMYYKQDSLFVCARYSHLPLQAAAKLAEKDPKCVGFGVHPEWGVQFYNEKAFSEDGKLQRHADWDCYLTPLTSPDGKEYTLAANTMGWHHPAFPDEAGMRPEKTHKNLGMMYHKRGKEFLGARYNRQTLQAAIALAEEDYSCVGFSVHPQRGVQFCNKKALRGGTLMAHEDWDTYLKPDTEYAKPTKPTTDHVSLGGKEYRFAANVIGWHDGPKNLGMMYPRREADFIGARYSRLPLEAAAKVAEEDTGCIGFGVHELWGVQFYSELAFKSDRTLEPHPDWDVYIKPGVAFKKSAPLLSTSELASEPNPKEVQVWSKLIAMSKPEWCTVFFALVLGLIREALTVYLPLLLVNAMNAGVEYVGHAGEQDAAVRKAESARAGAVIAASVIGILWLNVLSFMIGAVSDYLIDSCGELIVARLRSDLYMHILRQEIAFFDKEKIGELVSRLGADTILVQQAVTRAPTYMFTGIFKLLCAFAVMSVLSFKLMFVSTLLIAPVGLTIAAMRMLSGIAERYQEGLSKGATASTEAMASMRTVRACQGEPVERKRYVAFIGDVLQMKGRIFPKKDGSVLREGYVRAFAYACLNAMAQMVALAAYFCSMWYGMTLILTNELDFGQLAAFQQYGFFIIAGINSITTANFMLAQLAGGAARVFALLARQPAFETQPGPWAMTPKDRMRGDLIFENITFTYPTRPEAPIIRGLTLHVPADTSAALVGSSGSGKSTLIQLLLRFYDPDSGRVLVDGHNVKSLDPQWLRGSIALVQQEPILFGVSIRENVAYGVAHRYISKDLDRAAVRVIGGPGREAPIPCDVDDSLDAIQSACKMSNAHDFISSFPDGYDTLCGERGASLSGGQKQRIAIARALFCKPRVLLLDEATSALDTESERLVQEAIDRVTSGRTVLIIAHRLSTIRDANNIAVVSGGKIIDAAPHDELLVRCDEYRQLVHRQMGAASSEMKAIHG